MKRKPRVPDYQAEASADLYDLEDTEFNNVDKDEQKEIYQFK